MRLWMLPLIAVGLFAGGRDNGEPTEQQMRAAFEQSLALQVRNALEFAQEAGGVEAVTMIRDNGTDRYEINAFRKLGCRAAETGREFVCDFAVDIGLVNGPMQQTLSGRFKRRDDTLVFAASV